MSSLSIVHLDTGKEWRGGQQALLTLAKGLRERGHTQIIACPKGSALEQRARLEGFEVLSRWPKRVDILHAHSGRAQNSAAWEGWRARRKVVTRHVAFTPKHPLVHRLKYSLTCHGIIAVSESVRRVLVDAGISTNKIEVIHTGVEIPEQARRTESRGFVIGHMGAFTPEKGQDVAVAAADLVPQYRFVLAGEGPMLAALRARATNNVTFPGFVSDHRAFFAALDLFIMPSRSEGWGLAAIEAMSHGVPVIASDIEGLAEIIDPGSGWLVPPGDAQALAKQILAVVSDRDILRATGMRARERAGQFSIQKMAEKTERFYLRLLVGQASSLQADL